MAKLPSPRFFALLFASACTSEPTDVVVTLAPNFISSLNGSTEVQAVVLSDSDTLSDEPLEITVAYTDRNGLAHEITPATGTSDERGVVTAVLTGLTWDGGGTVTVAAGAVEGQASFAVIDRSPPRVTITVPGSGTVPRDGEVTIQVHAVDEIGISQVLFGASDRSRDQNRIASGAADVTLSFDFEVPDVNPGTTLQLFALAEDLSGNQGTAVPVTVTVGP